MSFAPEDAGKVKKLIPLLTCPDYELDFYDMPEDLDFEAEGAEEARRAIGEKITRCSVALCLIGEDTHKSRWVDCHLRKNRNKGNRIIAMAIKGVQCAVLPAIIKEEFLTFYPWDTQKVKALVASENP